MASEAVAAVDEGLQAQGHRGQGGGQVGQIGHLQGAGHDGIVRDIEGRGIEDGRIGGQAATAQNSLDAVLEQAGQDGEDGATRFGMRRRPRGVQRRIDELARVGGASGIAPDGQARGIDVIAGGQVADHAAQVAKP